MVSDDQKTVFISYRRSASRYTARSIFEHLKANGYDAFLDVESIDSGNFERIILGQIKARAHFVVVLSAGTIKRFEEPSDWLRREIEYAIDQKRNIIPVMVDKFKFDKKTTKFFTGKLEQLMSYNALQLYHDYFDEAMTRLRERYLKQPVDGDVVPIPSADLATVERVIAQAVTEPKPTKNQLDAEIQLNLGELKIFAQDYDGAIADFIKVIKLTPRNAEAYLSSGNAREEKGDLNGAIADFNKAIELNPQFAEAYSNRGNARKDRGDLEGAFADYNKAIELNPKLAGAYSNRGISYGEKGDFDGAIADFNKAIELNPQLAEAYSNRGNARTGISDFDGAIADCNKAIELNPQFAVAYYNRGNARTGTSDFDGAIADFNKAIELNPQFAVAYYGRALTRYKKSDFEGVLADCQMVISIKPDGNAYNGRGVAYFALQKYQEASINYKKALEYDPELKHSIGGLAVTYHVLGDLVKARRYWRKLLKIDDRYKDAEWVREELNWAEPLVEEAKKLIARL